jgi:hypothetical protein
VWAQGITIVIGIWLVASPDLMGYGGSARVNNQIIGIWMATLSMVAISECLRAVRWANFVLGVWLILAPFVLDYLDGAASGSLVMGLAVMFLALIRGRMSERFDGGWSALWQKTGPLPKGVRGNRDHVKTTSPGQRTRANQASEARTAG